MQKKEKLRIAFGSPGWSGTQRREMQGRHRFGLWEAFPDGCFLAADMVIWA